LIFTATKFISPEYGVNLCAVHVGQELRKYSDESA